MSAIAQYGVRLFNHSFLFFFFLHHFVLPQSTHNVPFTAKCRVLGVRLHNSILYRSVCVCVVCDYCLLYVCRCSMYIIIFRAAPLLFAIHEKKKQKNKFQWHKNKSWLWI